MFFMSVFWDENLHFDQLDLSSGPFNSTGKTQGSVLSHCITFLQIAGIWRLLPSGRLIYIQCKEILLERGAWQGRRDRFKRLSMDEMSSNTAELKLQAEIDVVSVDHFAFCLCNLVCMFVCVCVSVCVQGFYVFQQRDRAVCHPIYGLRPFSGQENPAFPLRGAAAVTSKIISTRGATVHCCLLQRQQVKIPLAVMHC